jgi:MerR HTH family regulatory protein
MIKGRLGVTGDHDRKGFQICAQFTRPALFACETTGQELTYTVVEYELSAQLDFRSSKAQLVTQVRYREYIVRGKPMGLCTVGELAKALNRSSVTIRTWEREGVLPPSGYRHPSQDPRGSRRLYSRAQVEGIVTIADEEGILTPGPRVTIAGTRFTERVKSLFHDLHPADSRARPRDGSGRFVASDLVPHDTAASAV